MIQKLKSKSFGVSIEKNVNNKENMDEAQSLQSREYDFPYHYIPFVYSSGKYALHRRWNYAANWLAGFHLVREHCGFHQSEDKTFIDLGCGDGALANYLSVFYPKSHFIGIDYDRHAIQLASLLRKANTVFYATDITASIPDCNNADCLALIEVIEHIPPSNLQSFLQHAASLLAENGKVLISVPHINKPLTPKHYQHFTFKSLESLISESLTIHKIFGFGRMTLKANLLEMLTSNNYLRLENGKITQRLVKELARSRKETAANRIFCVAGLKA